MFKINRVLFTVIYYVIAAALFVIGSLIEPTSLAGPGFDMLVYFVVFISSIILFIIDLVKIKRGRQFIISATIHFIFIAGTIVILNFPHLFDPK